MNISMKIIFFDHIKKLMILRLPVFMKLILLRFLMRIYMENVEEMEDFIYEDYLDIFIEMVDKVKNFDNLNHLNPNGNSSMSKKLTNYFVVSFASCFEVNSFNSELNYEIIKGAKEVLRFGLANTTTNMIQSHNEKFELFVRKLLIKIC